MDKVKFKNYRTGIELSGNLYLPDNFDSTKKYPAIVVTHPGGGVKEQTAGMYAEKLSKLGYVTLAYDATYQGESGGEPRYIDNPFQRSEDNSVAADYLSGLDFVDEDKLGILGICAGGGHAVNCASTDHRFRAVATVSAFNVGPAFRMTLNLDDMDALDKAVLASNKAREIEAHGGPASYGTYVPATEEDAKASGSTMMYEAWEYYRTPRGACPTATNQIDVSSFMDMWRYDAFAPVHDMLTQPLLMIAGSKAESLMFSEDCIAKARCPKELFLIDGATHVDLYDKEQYVPQVVEKLGSFYGEHIGA